MIEDEGPSPEDLARFEGDTAYCSDCGAEIWDQVDLCPECGAHLPDGPQRIRPDELHFQRKWILVLVILVVIALVLLFA